MNETEYQNPGHVLGEDGQINNPLFCERVV